MSIKSGIEIPFEVADGICLQVLMDTYKTIKSCLDNHILEGVWMHEEDVPKSYHNLHCLKTLIEYFGGDINDL